MFCKMLSNNKAVLCAVRRHVHVRRCVPVGVHVATVAAEQPKRSLEFESSIIETQVPPVSPPPWEASAAPAAANMTKATELSAATAVAAAEQAAKEASFAAQTAAAKAAAARAAGAAARTAAARATAAAEAAEAAAKTADAKAAAAEAATAAVAAVLRAEAAPASTQSTATATLPLPMSNTASAALEAPAPEARAQSVPQTAGNWAAREGAAAAVPEAPLSAAAPEAEAPLQQAAPTLPAVAAVPPVPALTGLVQTPADAQPPPTPAAAAATPAAAEAAAAAAPASVAAAPASVAAAAAATPAEAEAEAAAAAAPAAVAAAAAATPAAAAAEAAAMAAPAAVAAAAATMPAPPLSFADRPGLRDAAGRLQLKNLTYEELVEWCQHLGHDVRRALQLWKAMYGDNRWLRSLAESDGLSAPFAAAFKAAVSDQASLGGGLTLQSVSTARDGTHKLIFALHGTAEGAVETVLIPMKNRDGSQLRYTACLSSQVGCAMNCQFCYTGRMGLLANLTTAQMVEQLVEARRWLAAYTRQQQPQQQDQQQKQQDQQLPVEALQQPADKQKEQPAVAAAAAAYKPSSSTVQRSRGKGKHSSDGGWPQPPPRINNIVFMGMGEPLHNMSALMPALDILCHPQGLALSRSKVIVSTVGLVPQLRQLRASQKAKLAVSLHATTDEVRNWIIPTNRKYPLAELLGALRELYPLPQPKKKQPAPLHEAGSSTSSSGDGPSSSSSDGGGSTKLTSSNESGGSNSSSSRSSSVRSDDFVVIEYVLLKGVNDTDDDAHRLVQLLREIYCMVNLIVFNPHQGTRFKRSEQRQVDRFREILMEGGKVCTVRMSKGDDEMAACGQLGNPQAATRPAPLLRPPSKLQEKLPGAAAAAEQQAALLQQQILKQQQKGVVAF